MADPLLFLADPYSSAHQLGYVVGACTFPLLFVAGAIGAGVAMRRPDASWKALLGLTLVLAGFACFGAMAAIKNLAGPAAAGDPIAGGLCAALTLVGMGLLVSGAVFAIIGIVESYRHSERYRRGRKRGYLAFAIVAVPVAFAVFGVIAQRLQISQEAAGLQAHEERHGPPLSIKEFNYGIEPPAGWEIMDAKKFNPLASAAFMHANPALFGMVVAEHARIDGAVTTLTLAEVVKAQFRSRQATAAFAPDETVKIGGADGLRLKADFMQGGVPMVIEYSITRQLGNAYQLVTWGEARARLAIQQANAEMRNSFKLVDPKRTADAGAARAGQTYRSASHGWSADLEGTWWTEAWEGMEKNAPSAEWGICNASYTAFFCVTPLWVKEGDADLDAVTHALLERYGVSPTDDGIYGVKEWHDSKQPQVSGRSLAWEGTRNGTRLLFRFRVVRAKTCSYLLSAWFDAKSESWTDMLEEAFDHVRFSADPPKPLDRDWMSKRELAAQQIFYNSLGVYYDQKGQAAQAEPWYKRGYQLGRNDPTILLNYIGAMAAAGKKQEALTYLESQVDRFKDNPKIAFARANMQFAAGDAAGGLATAQALFDNGFRDDESFAGFIRMACEQHQSEAALAALEKYAQGKESTRLRRLRALIYTNQRAFDKAIAVLTEIHHAEPENTATLLQLAQCNFAAARYDDCLGYCEQLIAAHQESAEVYRQKGLAEYSLKRYREAKDSMEKAHEKDPGDAEMKRTADYLAGMLGQGANGAVKTPIAALEAPPDFRTAPDAKAGDPYLSGFSAYYRQDWRTIVFERGKELKTTDHQVIFVGDQQGVQAFSTLDFPFDPLSEEIYVNDLTVKDAHGGTLAAAKVEDSYVVDEGAESTASQRKILHVPVPGLQPGSTIECTVTRRETGDNKAFTFRAQMFSKTVPVLQSVLVLKAPRDAVKWEGTPGVEPKKSKDSLAWIVERPPVLRFEPHEAPLEKVLPFVWLGDAAATWAGEAKDYLASIKERLTIEPAVRQAAADAVKNLDNEPAKIAALSRLLQRDLAYKGIEFGRRARIPAPAAQIWSNRYGDCKDHALLLSQMLESVGIPAHLALVSTGFHIRTGLPSLDQFNHMIVFVPGAKKGTFIDCTGKSADLSADGPPQALATQEALILDGEHSHLETIPDYPPGCAGVKVEREIAAIEGSTNLTVKESLVFTGVTAASMRAALTNVQVADRKRTLLQMMNVQLPSVDLRSAEVEDFDDPHLPLRFRLDYVVPQRCEIAGKHLFMRPPAAWERMLLAPTPVEKRYTPFRIWVPMIVECTQTIIGPAGWQAETPEARKIDKPFCTASLTAHFEGKVMRVACRLDQRTGEFPPAQYAAYSEAMNSALGLIEQSVVYAKH